MRKIIAGIIHESGSYYITAHRFSGLFHRFWSISSLRSTGQTELLSTVLSLVNILADLTIRKDHRLNHFRLSPQAAQILRTFVPLTLTSPPPNLGQIKTTQLYSQRTSV